MRRDAIPWMTAVACAVLLLSCAKYDEAKTAQAPAGSASTESYAQPDPSAEDLEEEEKAGEGYFDGARRQDKADSKPSRGPMPKDRLRELAKAEEGRAGKEMAAGEAPRAMPVTALPAAVPPPMEPEPAPELVALGSKQAPHAPAKPRPKLKLLEKKGKKVAKRRVSKKDLGWAQEGESDEEQNEPFHANVKTERLADAFADLDGSEDDLAFTGKERDRGEHDGDDRLPRLDNERSRSGLAHLGRQEGLPGAGAGQDGTITLDSLAINGELAQKLEVKKPAPRPRPRPSTFLPRQAYFENRYLGGNAAHDARIRELDRDLGAHTRPYAAAHAPVQPFDPPTSDAIALTATLDRRWIDEPGYVTLQVGLQGSQRYGWRRPPLDVAVVIDGALRTQASGDEPILALLDTLRLRLGPQDRLGVIVAGAGADVVARVEPIKRLPRALDTALGRRVPSVPSPPQLEAALDAAGAELQHAARDQARVAGSQVVLLLTPSGGSSAGGRPTAAARAAHRLTVQGAVTSVIEVGNGGAGDWWPVAAAGHGNYHRTAGTDDDAMRGAVDEELELLSKVVARLLRIIVRLGKHTHAVRILGSRLLGQQEVKEVKAREEATDRNLAVTLGVKADRGDDDDGLQTVIPYYYGGDSHVVLIELWVDEPGPVAEVSLKYKDMVKLGNATAGVGVSLGRTPRDATPDQRLVQLNLQGFAVADALLEAADDLRRHDVSSARRRLDSANRTLVGSATDRALVAELRQLVDREWGGPRQPLLADALTMAAHRKVGLPASGR